MEIITFIIFFHLLSFTPIGGILKKGEISSPLRGFFLLKAHNAYSQNQQSS